MLPLIMVLVLAGAPKADPKLAGSWTLDGEPFCTLKADGTGSFDEDRIRWGVKGDELVITGEDETERVPYTLAGDSLTLHMGGIPITLTRVGKAGKAQGKVVQVSGTQPSGGEEAKEAAKKEPAARGAGKDALSQLLVSSAWCSFSFNKHSGTTSRSRVQFLPDGSWSSGGQAETYHSGASGSVAGQYNSGGGGQWAVKGGQLFMSDPPETPSLEPIEPFSVTKNSNGSPIINAMGKEYARCD